MVIGYGNLDFALGEFYCSMRSNQLPSCKHSEKSNLALSSSIFHCKNVEAVQQKMRSSSKSETRFLSQNGYIKCCPLLFEREMLYHHHLPGTCQILQFQPLSSVTAVHFANSMLWLVEFHRASVLNQSAYKLRYINSCDNSFRLPQLSLPEEFKGFPFLRQDEANKIL